MGWWGHDILSGDAPLDVLGDLGDQLGFALELYPDGAFDDPDVAAQVAGALAELTLETAGALVSKVTGATSDAQLRSWATRGGSREDELFAALQDDRDDTLRVGWQVLAVTAMAAGAPLDDQVKAAMVAAGEQDGWGREDLGRRAAIDRYLATLRDYDGVTPTALPSATLGDAFAAAAEADQDGPVNL